MSYLQKTWVLASTATVMSCFLNLGALLCAQDVSLPRVYVLDQGAKSVTTLRLSDGTVLGASGMSDEPRYLVLSPDGSKLLVFHATPFESAKIKSLPRDARRNGRAMRRPKIPHAMSIVDTHDMTVQAKLEDVGWNAAPQLLRWVYSTAWQLKESLIELTGFWDDSGRRFSILSWGTRDHPPEIVQLDLTTAGIVGRLRLACETKDVLAAVLIRQGTMAAVAYANTVLLWNLRTLLESRKITLPDFSAPTELTPSPDGSYLYVSTAGDPQHQVPARVHIVSPHTATITQSVDCGAALTRAVTDKERGLTFFAGRQRDASALVVLRDGRITAELRLADIPIALHLAPRTHRLYVLSYNSLQAVDLDTIRLVGNMPIPHRKTGLWESNPLAAAPPSALALNSLETRGFLTYRGDDEISVLDLTNLTMINTIDWVSGWKNFGKTMLGAATSGALEGAAKAGIFFPGETSYRYSQPNSISYSSMAVDPKDRFLYVLGPSHLDVIDIASNKKVSGVDLPLYDLFLEFLPTKNASILLVHGVAAEKVGAKSFLLSGITAGRDVPTVYPIDTGTNRRLLDEKWESEFFFTTDMRHLVHYDQRTIYCRETDAFSVVKSVGGFKRISQIVVAP